jgi:hypothetical protein
VTVYDDGSEDPNTVPKHLCAEAGWTWISAVTPHGKENWWRWVSRIYADQRESNADLFVFLPDDVRLCQNFFKQALSVWSTLVGNKLALNLLKDSRERCWGSKIGPLVASGRARLTGWIDGAFLCCRRYFEQLGWAVPEVDLHRWDKNKHLGSGVYAAVTEKLKGQHLYGVVRSLLVHVQAPSVMNAAARETVPLKTQAFVGKEKVKALEQPDLITASMATVPGREASLEQVVQALLPQVDRLNVYLNNFHEIPSCLWHPQIEAVRSEDLSDAGKFFWSGAVQGYHFTVDDDLLYPDDYVTTLIGAVERHQRKALVGVHGAVLLAPMTSYYKNRLAFHCLSALPSDRPVHVLGTGTLAYHTSTIKLSVSDFKSPNMADLWLSLAAERQGVHRIAIRRMAHWLTLLPTPPGTTIYERFKDQDQEQTKVAHDLHRGRPHPGRLRV